MLQKALKILSGLLSNMVQISVYKLLLMTNDYRMELQIWRGDWGLPSIDPQCLAVIVSRLNVIFRFNFE